MSIQGAAASVVNNVINTASNGVSKLYEDGKGLVSNTANKIVELPSDIGNVIVTVETIPLKIVEKVNELQKTTAILVTVPEKVGSIIGNIATIAKKSITKNGDKLQQSLNDSAKGVVGAVSKSTLNGLYGIPVVGQLTAAAVGTAATSAAALESANNVVGVGTKIMDDFVKEAADQIGSGQTGIGQSGTGQTGGAKTKRHLKKIIRDRQFIQTRTNKMIREFINPGLTKTHNKKYISKKSKRRRRR